MDITHSLIDSVHVLDISGRLDAATAPAFRDACTKLLEAGHSNLVVSFSGTSFIDSSGLGVLVSVLRNVTKIGGDVRLAALPPEVKTLFELTRLNKVFDMYVDPGSAASSFQQNVL